MSGHHWALGIAVEARARSGSVVARPPEKHIPISPWSEVMETSG
jgi:hypothetical protein